MPLLSLLFFLIGIGAAILTISLGRVVDATLSLLQVSHIARSSLETWLTGTVIPTMPFVSLASIVVAGLLLLFRRKEQEWTQRLIKRMTSEGSVSGDAHPILGMPGRHFLIWCLVCCAFVLVPYWPTLVHGFFRYDDFEIVSFIGTGSLWEIIFVPHDDHTYSLFRLVLAGMLALFGVSPLPYNIALLSIFVVMFLFAVLMMREMKVNTLGILVALTLFTGLAAWGETISGYYTQTIHPGIALLCFMSIWAYVRWGRTGKNIFAVVAAVTMGLAALVDISGFWVPPAVLTFAACHHFASNKKGDLKSFLRAHLWIGGAALGTLLLGTGLAIYVFIVVAPGDFLLLAKQSMPGDTPYSVVNILQQLFFIVTGGLLLPLFFPIGYWRLPASVLVAVLSVLLLLAVGGGLLAWRKMNRPTRWYALSVLAIMLGTCLMAVLGRAHEGFSHGWPSKYIGVPYLWFSVLVALVWDAVWKQVRIVWRPAFFQMTAIVLAVFLSVQTIFDVVTSRTEAKAPGSGYGYRSNINDAKIRKEALEALRSNLIVSLSQGRDGEVSLPNLGGVYINGTYPSLSPFNNLADYGAFVIPSGRKVAFVKNGAVQSYSLEREVQTVSSLRNATDTGFREALESDAYTQRLYLASVPLESQRRRCKGQALGIASSSEVINAEPATDLSFESKGEAAVVVREEPWDPERAHHLEMAIQADSYNNEAIRLELTFSGELKIPYPRSWIELRDHQGECISTDLLQVYAYALNPQVKQLVVRFRTPGRYKISRLALGNDSVPSQ